MKVAPMVSRANKPLPEYMVRFHRAWAGRRAWCCKWWELDMSKAKENREVPDMLCGRCFPHT